MNGAGSANLKRDDFQSRNLILICLKLSHCCRKPKQYFQTGKVENKQISEIYTTMCFVSTFSHEGELIDGFWQGLPDKSSLWCFLICRSGSVPLNEMLLSDILLGHRKVWWYAKTFHCYQKKNVDYHIFLVVSLLWRIHYGKVILYMEASKRCFLEKGTWCADYSLPLLVRL